jgi:hypothetical protein
VIDDERIAGSNTKGTSPGSGKVARAKMVRQDHNALRGGFLDYYRSVIIRREPCTVCWTDISCL